jgi:HEAT repeat protein
MTANPNVLTEARRHHRAGSRGKLLLCLLLGLLLPMILSSLYGAEAATEQQLIATLQSKCSLQEKDAACAQLKLVGTARCVPALAALLGDEQLSHSARYALEPMQAPEAGKALLKALGQAKGLTRIGIIYSLGNRHDEQAASALAKLLNQPDAPTASAAATALGQIGTPAALKALQGALERSTGAVHRAVVDAHLRCANRLLASGSQSKALPIFQRLYEREKAEHIRVAAYRGMILASGPQGLPLMLQAIAGPANASQTAALQLVHDIDLPGATEALAGLLLKANIPVQTALIDGLAQRNDVAAVSGIVLLAGSPDPGVRLAALKALGPLGSGAQVLLLAEAAAFRNGDEQKAARLSLATLHRGHITEQLLVNLTTGQPERQAEVARALGERGDQAAVPKLLELAQASSGSTRKASFQALAQLADEPQLPFLVKLVLDAKDEVARAEAAETLNSACQHVRSQRGQLSLEFLAKGLASGPVEGRAALLSVCGSYNDPQLRAALRNALADSNPILHEAAVRALCDTTDAELLPDVQNLACKAPEESLRSLAISGCVRLLTQEESVRLSATQRAEALKSILATPLRADQKRLVLAGLAEIPDAESLKLVEPLLEDAEVKAEAARAAIKLAPAVPGLPASDATALLKKLIATTSDASLRQAAEAAVKQVEGRADFITCWQAVGPFRKAGQNYAALFDIVFPPEEPGAPKCNWQPLPVGTDAKRPWLLDLLKPFGGQDCVAYARTWIRSEQEQPARLELGSDDGVKVWFNGKVVHANNASRPLTPGSDVVNITLAPGWNSVLLKVTQNNQGWEFCARVLKPDGAHLDGLQFSAAR